MNWINVSKQLPQETGNYLASVGVNVRDGQYVFTDLVHFDSITQKWFKYDPFDPGYAPKEEITHLIKGWITDSVTYLG